MGSEEFLNVDTIWKSADKLLTTDDIELLYETADGIQAEIILEIGSKRGGSALVLSQIARKYNGRLHCIDPFILPELRQNLERHGLDIYTSFIQAKSPWVDVSQVQTPIDFLFIDGDHRARWALMDYHYWVPWVRIGGYIAFHDVHALDWAGQGVRRAIDIIWRTDKELIHLVAETENHRQRGIKVFEKVKEV